MIYQLETSFLPAGKGSSASWASADETLPAVSDDDISVIPPPPPFSAIPAPPPLSPQMLDKELEFLRVSSFGATTPTPTPTLTRPSPSETTQSPNEATPSPSCRRSSTSSIGKRKRPLKEVSFCNDSLLYPAPWTDQEVQASWYTAQELSDFKKERKETVRQLKRVGFDLHKVGEKYCLRGYEPYFSVEMNKATKCARDLVSCTVFVEQNRQRLHGFQDAECLRQRSEQASQWARDNAQELGTTDAKESRLFQHGPPFRCLGLPYCHYHASCVLAASCQQILPSRIGLVNKTMVQQLESALRAAKDLLAQA